jgi:hypothetical protein
MPCRAQTHESGLVTLANFAPLEGFFPICNIASQEHISELFYAVLHTKP